MTGRTAWETGPGTSPVRRNGLRIASHIVALFDACATSTRRACLFLTLVSLLAFLPGFFALPVLDRDEARFALISRQMVETGDLTDVRLGLEGQRTRPFGLYWLQSALVAGAQAVGMPDAARSIWLYRLPSLLLAIASVLLSYWAALGFVGRRAALLAGLLLATSASVGVIARLAVPDAAMLAAAAAMIGAIGRLYVRETPVLAAGTADPSATRRLVALFWAALAFAFLFKGLFALVYPALALTALVALDRSLRLPRLLARFPLGIVLLLAMGAIWYYLRHFAGPTDGLTTRFVVGWVAPAFTGIGAPPGAFLLMFWALFWPAAPLVALAVPIIWKARRLRGVRSLLVWILPVWFLLELLPTKFPAHLVPTFPAIAILVGLAVEKGALALANARLARILWLWPLLGAIIAISSLLVLAVLDRTTSLLAWPLLLAGLFALITAASAVREYGVEKATLLALAGTLVSGFGVVDLVIPKMESLWLSRRMAAVVEGEACAAGAASLAVGTAGYNEASLMFELPGRTWLLDGGSAADFLKEGGCRLVFVESRQEARFVRRAEAIGLRIERRADIRGYEYTNGRRVRISLYRNSGG